MSSTPKFRLPPCGCYLIAPPRLTGSLQKLLIKQGWLMQSTAVKKWIPREDGYPSDEFGKKFDSNDLNNKSMLLNLIPLTSEGSQAILDFLEKENSIESTELDSEISSLFLDSSIHLLNPETAEFKNTESSESDESETQSYLRSTLLYRSKNSRDILDTVNQNKNYSQSKSDSKTFTFIDLFAGIGGFRLGLEKLGGKCIGSCEIDRFARYTYEQNFFPEDSISGQECRKNCVGWTYGQPMGAPIVYRYQMEFYQRDITNLCLRQILGPESGNKKVDVLTGGFPCQSFSSLGKREGFSGQKTGALFFHLLRIIGSCRPKFFILENVKGLVNMREGKGLGCVSLNHSGDVQDSDNHSTVNDDMPMEICDHGDDKSDDDDDDKDQQKFQESKPSSTTTVFDTCLEFLRNKEYTGGDQYEVSWKILDAAQLVPQRRERVYIIGVNRNKIDKSESGIDSAESLFEFTSQYLDQNFNVPKPNLNRDVIHEYQIKDHSESEANVTVPSRYFLSPYQWNKAQKIVQDGKYIQIHADGSGQLVGDVNKNSSSESDSNSDSSALYPPTHAQTLCSSYRTSFYRFSQFVMPPMALSDSTESTSTRLPRFFTPRECLRIQGFPESYMVPTVCNTTNDNKMDLEGPFYQQIGNAVVPPMISMVGMKIANYFYNNSSSWKKDNHNDTFDIMKQNQIIKQMLWDARGPKGRMEFVNVNDNDVETSKLKN